MIKFDITLISYQISLIHESIFQLPNVSSAGQPVVNLLISNSQVLHKKSDGEDEPLPSSLGLALCSPEMSFNFLVQKTNRSKEAPVLNERIASFKNSQDGKGPFMKIFNKDSVDRHITTENFKGFRAVDAELLIQVSTTGCKDYPFIASSGQEFNTLKFHHDHSSPTLLLRKFWGGGASQCRPPSKCHNSVYQASRRRLF
jgi:hypothetical protein